MKNTFYLLFIFTIGLIVSCDKKDDANPEPITTNELDMESIEEKLKTMTPPKNDGFQSLITRIKESSQGTELMDSKSLLESILSSEFLPLVYAQNDLQSGFEWFNKHNVGLNALMKRNDAHKVILKKYQEMPIIGYSRSASLEDKGNYSLKILFLETLLAQKPIVSSLFKASHSDYKSDVVKLIFDKMKIKKTDTEVYGHFSDLGSVFFISRIMKLDDSYNFSSTNSDDLSTFLEKGHIISSETADIILSRASSIFLK